MPDLIEKYNGNMRGVDMMDNMVGAYRVRVWKRKWWWCVYSWFLSVVTVNTWKLIMRIKNKKIPHLTILRDWATNSQNPMGIYSPNGFLYFPFSKSPFCSPKIAKICQNCQKNPKLSKIAQKSNKMAKKLPFSTPHPPGVT